MNCIIILFVYIIGALITLASGAKYSAKIALGTSLVNAVIALILANGYMNGEDLLLHNSGFPIPTFPFLLY